MPGATPDYLPRLTRTGTGTGFKPKSAAINASKTLNNV